MTIADWLQVGTFVTAVVIGGGKAGEYYLTNEYDDRYVLVSTQNLKLLYDAQDELARIQRRINNGTATQQDRERAATLKERIRNLQGE